MNKKSFIIFVWVILLSACVSQKKALQSSNSLNNSQPENTWKIDKVT
jgi:starvation-inducible outer membrane lipoprotein